MLLERLVEVYRRMLLWCFGWRFLEGVMMSRRLVSGRPLAHTVCTTRQLQA